MALIDRISKLKHPGVLHDFTWPQDLAAFGRYNLIYGWNGSGKTTISRLFHAIETRAAPTNYKAEVFIHGQVIHGPAFSQATLPVRVFNRDFVAANVTQTPGGDVPPILVLGEDSVEKQAQVEELRASLREAIAERDKRRVQRDSNDSTLDRHCIREARAVKEALRSMGQNPYNNFDKSRYQSRAQEMLNSGNGKNHRLAEDLRRSLRLQINETPKEKIGEIKYTFPKLSEISADVVKLLKMTVVSATIQSLEHDERLSSWVHEGINLHDSYGTMQCLFCEQTLPQDRMDRLKAHFNAAYERLLENIDEQIGVLELAAEDTASLELPHGSQFYDDLAKGYEDALAEFSRMQQEAFEALSVLVDALTKKKGQVFAVSALDHNLPSLSDDTVGDLNLLVRKHNTRCDGFEAQIVAARKSLAADMIAGSLDEFESLNKDVQKSKSEATEASNEVTRLKGEIAQLEQEIVEHRRPAAELNEDLRKYLGHGELHFEVKDTGYAITRRGEPAQSLSEGEVTAVALLYFLKSLDDRRFDAPNGVVVLDDPVSSLDANSLFLAFGFIRERTQHAGQLFILTHNFAFFRNVKNWLHHMRGQRRKEVSSRPARLYMLEWQFATETGQRLSTLRQLDPLLEWYESEYHYLFARIFLESQNAQTTLAENYVLPNMARRLLEGFLAFRMPQISGDLWSKLREVEFDEVMKTRILRFVNTHSHSDGIGEPEHDPSLLAEARPVLKDLLTLIKTLDPDHYRAMEELVNSPREEDAE